MKVTSSLTELSIQAALGSSILEADSRVIQSENWYQVITPSIKETSLNEVIISRVPKHEAAQRVDETIHMYKQLGLPFKWCIGPMSNTESIEPLIQYKASDSWFYRGMIAECNLDIKSNPQIHVERVTPQNFNRFLDVFLSGWSLESYRRSAQDKFKKISSNTTDFPYFLAFHNQQPIGTAGTVIKSNYGYLVGAVVLPEFRGVGAYKSLLKARLDDLNNRKFKYAITHARDATSAPILERLGFATTFNAKIYKFD